ncbi:hypothetical protein MPER_05259 [Moniliophthora perniciosa FA553]|nr:hypothetical protein MPER_05259 [Moniliophthora perniciosa FA553]
MVTDEDGLSHTTSLASVQPTDVKLPRSSSLDGFPVHLYNQIALKKLALNTFYSPDAQNNPLWDLLLITQESDVYVIWVFQMTTASDHKRLREGYISIRRIMTEFEQQNSQGQRLSFEMMGCLESGICRRAGLQDGMNIPQGTIIKDLATCVYFNYCLLCTITNIAIKDGSADCTAQ